MSGARQFRGLGRGRKTRRALARGGTGAGQRLNQILGAWPGVKITPMFGRWGYFVAERLFACFPLAPNDAALWLRLDAADQARALREAGVRPHRRFARRGWIEIAVVSASDLPLALRWLRRAHAAATAAGGRDDRDVPAC